ncbi:bifunctional heptose 7-phosphate kinase/heptose 1-phosphate adenyltransferase [Aureibacter tunicatorum]|uniref:RfaE bifunctional protein kinase chain/domain n=1 Tax=Aureibacter tunicatorum TaxID=866807 RepID=A0AAE4BRY8_9BACT|nr:bifunctional ADP-heptose synthase [Aureibacter tunicatorum]MDR6237762.1 rfaE bifunctional protein kinase chain/domain [Aureibacter tunicatorum]BDD02797.1 carbohydrate kinase [Aureibacter tunicatorum]
MNFENIEQIGEAFNQMRVLIIGDVMIDSYVWGSVDRISPEAPVPVVNVRKKEVRMGGAANVAKNIQSLGATPILCSIIGKDVDGDTFFDLLNRKQISAEGIVSSDNRVTTLKERVLSGSQQLLRIDSETDKPLSEEEESQLLKRIYPLMENIDVIIFEDYDKGVLNKNVIKKVVSWANEKRIPTVVDPKKRNFLDYHGVTLFKPNLKEIKEGLKIDFNPDEADELKYAVDKLLSHLQADSALITLSEKGVYIDNGSKNHHIPAHIRDISDVSGAGDTVISIASLCLALNLPLKFIAGLSNLGGGLVCEHLGVVPIDKERLLKEAERNNLLENA